MTHQHGPAHERGPIITLASFIIAPGRCGTSMNVFYRNVMGKNDRLGAVSAAARTQRTRAVSAAARTQRTRAGCVSALRGKSKYAQGRRQSDPQGLPAL